MCVSGWLYRFGEAGRSIGNSVDATSRGEAERSDFTVGPLSSAIAIESFAFREGCRLCADAAMVPDTSCGKFLKVQLLVHR